MLIFYTPAYCTLYTSACTYGSYDEYPKHPTLNVPCKYMVRREDLENV